jgi:DNA polymerase-3 subunit epsilon
MTFTALDFETATGSRASICQVGLVRVVDGKVVDSFKSFIKPPENKYWARFTDEIHGICAEMTADALEFPASWNMWRHWIEGQTVVAHNVSFDRSCLDQALEFYGLEPAVYETQCTYRIWGASLDSCCRGLGIPLENHHDALEDAMACAKLYLEAGRQGKV